MEAALIGEQISQVFVVINPNGEDLFVTWNKHNHTENNPDAISYIPEYVVEDDFENELEQGCQDWLDAVAAVKYWQQKQDLI
jgi:hypothetical protein